MSSNTIIILLCKNKSNYIIECQKYLSRNNIDTIIIEENNQIPSNFNGLNKIKNSPTAWESAFFYISHISQKYDYIYFIEDDVYTKKYENILQLIKMYSFTTADLITSNINNYIHDLNWYWWKNSFPINDFKIPFRSFNPICRISYRLIQAILNYRNIKNTFIFHEILFISLCIQYNFNILSFKKNTCPYIGNIRWRPVYKIKDIPDDKIYHPVKEHLT